MINRAFTFENCEVKTYTPEWYRAERIDYCEQNDRSKKVKTKKKFHLPVNTFLSFFL